MTACVLAAGSARANGRFPLANRLAIHPNDPSHLLVGATFGLLESRDGGSTFSWGCEAVLGLADQEDPMIVITDSGTAVFATFNGIVTSRDGCDYRTPPELSGEIIPDVALSPGVPDQVFAFRTASRSGGFDSELLRSDDAGESWQVVGPPLPEYLLPLTVDVSKSDPRRIYLTARLDRSRDYVSVLLRSDDGGLTFSETRVPGTQGQRFAFIGGVHPEDPDQIYLRVDDNAGTPVLRSVDGGATFETIFTGTGRLLGFALAGNGETVALGGPSDGIWAGPADTLEQRSTLGSTCLRFHGNVLYACADFTQTNFSLGRSTDFGATFEPLLTFQTLCGPSACAAETQVGGACGPTWNALGPQLGTVCGVTAGTGGATSGGAPAGGSGSGRSGGGGCSVGPSDTRGASGAWVVGLALLLRRARRNQLPRSRRPSA